MAPTTMSRASDKEIRTLHNGMQSISRCTCARIDSLRLAHPVNITRACFSLWYLIAMVFLREKTCLVCHMGPWLVDSVSKAL